LAFPVWTALLRGPYLARCSLLLSGDENPANDTASASGDVRVSGWRARSPMPAEPSNQAPKDGASMTFHPADRMVYAAKGNKTSDFYMWNPVTDTWTPLESIPPGPRGRKPKKGSSACADRSRYLYLVKGNNTSEFYRFDIQSRHWESLPSVPLLPSGKAVKGGGDMAFAEGRYGPNVYLLKGYKNDFLRYDIARESWFVMPSAPSQANPKWPAGSWLAHDGQSTIYAHKAQVSELWTFDVFSDAWSTAPRPGIPIQNSSGRTKKAKDGSAGVFLEGFLLALKGGNTNEFYVLDVSGNTWRPLESLPYGPGGKRTRVKAGGDLTGYSGYDRPGVPVSLPAVKGGGCDEVWDYKTDKESLAEKRDGIARAGSQWPAGCLRVYPNPVAEGVVTVAYQLEQPGPAAVGVYDVGGRCVAGQRADRSGSGSLLIDTRRLSAGVYVVRFRAGPLAASRKLVVSR
jgi:N-acetylneuraminic acid mutarotase